jgi:hypothetical protein
MAKTKISEFSSTPANNTDIDGINIAEGCPPSAINNAIRELMAQLKDQQAGLAGDNFTVGGDLSVSGNVTLTNALPIAQGGTGKTTAADAINALMPTQTNNSGKYLTTNGVSVSWGTVTSGSGNVSSVALSGGTTGLSVTGSPITTSGTITLGGTLAVANGGTGVATIPTGAVIVGNGTGAVSAVSASTAGNVLTVSGNAWTSSALPAATSTASGVVSTAAQTFAGVKTFNSGIRSATGLNFDTYNSLFWNSSGTTRQAELRIQNPSEVGANDPGSLRFFVNGTTAGFTMSDVQKQGGGSFNSYSDSRYKQDITSYNKGLAELKQIEPKNYRYTAEFMKSDSPSQQFVGVIAQELEGTAFSNCVKTDNNGFKIVDTSELTFALINAVKEMSQRIEQLEARNG